MVRDLKLRISSIAKSQERTCLQLQLSLPWSVPTVPRILARISLDRLKNNSLRNVMSLQEEYSLLFGDLLNK